MRSRRWSTARVATPVVVACLVLSGCSGPGAAEDAGELADGADGAGSRAASPRAATPSVAPEPSPTPTPDPELVARAVALQSAQQALAQDGRGTFEVRLTAGEPGGLLPQVQGGYDVAVPAGEFTATTIEPDREVVLRYRARGPRAWSQVLYPGSPLAPDCWYELAVAEGAVALPSQVSALFYLEPDPADPEVGATVLLLDALNAVGLTRVANLLDETAAEARVPVGVALRGEGAAARFGSWSLRGADLEQALTGLALDGAAQRALAEVSPVLADAAWRVVLQDQQPGPIRPPAARTVLVAGDVCRSSR